MRTMSLLTSQNDTAPKPRPTSRAATACLLTSQNDTAPKLAASLARPCRRLLTSQNDTAPKQTSGAARNVLGLLTSQNDTAPKPDIHVRRGHWVCLPVRMTLLQNPSDARDVKSQFAYQSE